jgi:hypothetical protein
MKLFPSFDGFMLAIMATVACFGLTAVLLLLWSIAPQIIAAFGALALVGIVGGHFVDMYLNKA